LPPDEDGTKPYDRDSRERAISKGAIEWLSTRNVHLTVERIGDLLTNDLPALLLPEMTR